MKKYRNKRAVAFFFLEIRAWINPATPRMSAK
jgi:hypothetical protein